MSQPLHGIGVLDLSAVLSKANPRLVYVSITGFGQSGPYADGRVYDAVIQAVSGISVAHPNQATGEPTLLATAVCDKLSALTAAQAICAALFARERHGGHGIKLELSMLDAALAFQWPDAMYNHTFLIEPPPDAPEFGVQQKPYRTRNGHVAAMTPQADEFAALCQGLGRADLPDHPRFANLEARRRHLDVLLPILDALIAGHDTDELAATLRAAGVPIGRVNRRAEVLRDPQVLHNRALVKIDHGSAGRVRLARSAARFMGGDLPLHGGGAAPGRTLARHPAATGLRRGQDRRRAALSIGPGAPAPIKKRVFVEECG